MPSTNPWILHVSAVRKAHPELRKDIVAVTKLAKKTYKPAAPAAAPKVKKAKDGKKSKKTILGTIRKALRMKGGADQQVQQVQQQKPAQVTMQPTPAEAAFEQQMSQGVAASTAVSGGGLLEFLRLRKRSKSPKRSSKSPKRSIKKASKSPKPSKNPKRSKRSKSLFSRMKKLVSGGARKPKSAKKRKSPARA